MKRALPLVLAVPLVIAALVGWRYLGQWISGPDPIHHVDAIVVTSGEPDRRVPVALDLLERGVSDRVFVVLWTRGPVVNEAERIRAYAAHRKPADAQAVEFVGASRSVLRDARVVLEATERHARKPRSFGVITSPWQTARVGRVFARTLGADVSVWSDGARYDAKHWYRKDGTTTALEAAKTVATLAILGPLPGAKGQRPPASLPLRALAGAFLAAAVIGVACRRLAHRLGLVSVPRLWRASATPTPMLGGLAILAGIVAGVIAAGGIHLGSLGAVAAAGVAVLALVGFVDDVAGLGPRTRLLWAAVAGAGAWLLGLRIDVLGRGQVAEVGDGVLTILWFVGVTHALNVLDHIDGATAAVGAMSAATIAAVAAVGGQFVVAAAAAAVAGACLGYLVHNFPPARLFMGDMGALALGFALAALALGLTPHQRVPLSAAVPALALGIPIFDTTLVTVSRLRAGRSPLVGGTDHVSHRLLARGFSLRGALGLLVGGQAALGVCAFVVAVAPRTVGWLLVIATAAAGVAALRFFLRQPEWTPPVHQEMSRDVRLALARAVDAIRMFEEAAETSGLASADPATMRALAEGARRLEGVGGRLPAVEDVAAAGDDAALEKARSQEGAP